MYKEERRTVKERKECNPVTGRCNKVDKPKPKPKPVEKPDNKCTKEREL